MLFLSVEELKKKNDEMVMCLLKISGLTALISSIIAKVLHRSALTKNKKKKKN